MRPQIDIVIPSRGPARSRSLLLADLDAQMALLPDAATLCVCEGASAAQNRNSGARQGKAQWIAFLDDDVRLGPDWLSTLNVIITRGARFDVLSGSITSTRPANVFSQAAEDFVVRHKRYGSQWYLVGAMLVVNRSAFEAIGGFDEAFVGAGGEDWDFCSRAHRLGLRVGVIPELRGSHANPTTLRGLMRRASSYGASEPATSMSSDASPSSITGRQFRGSLVARVVSWPIREYADLRKRGRSRIRALTSTVIYIPWMARYLWARRSTVSS